MNENTMNIHWMTLVRRLGLAGWMLFLLILTACGGATNQQGITVGTAAPPFTLPAAGGGDVSLAAYKGKQPVLLYFHMADG